MSYASGRMEIGVDAEVGAPPRVSDGLADQHAASMVADGSLPRAGVAGATLDVSIVIPFFNEEENAALVHQQVSAVMQQFGRSYELIFIDDGSTDGTFAALKALQLSDPHVRLIRFRRNFGQTAAIVAGFERASGAVIVTMDGDLQNDPRDVPTLLARIDEGWDIASGWRADRKDHFLTRTLPSRIANGLISVVSGLNLHDHGCTLKAYRAEIAKSLRLYGEMNRFITAVAMSVGALVTEVPVSHHPRRYGKSKYGLSRILKVMLDLILLKFLLAYAMRPLRVFGLAGLGAFTIGLIVTSYLSFVRLVLHHPIAGRPLLLFGMLMVIFGVQLISLGLLGELLVRIYHESQRKPIYFVRDARGWQTSAPQVSGPNGEDRRHE